MLLFRYPELETIHHLLKKIGTTRNGLFFAFPMVAVGRMMKIDKKCNVKIYIVLIFSLVECFICKKYLLECWLELSIFSWLIAYYLFQICITNQIIVNEKVSFALRKMSTIIYIIHPLIISI